MSSSSSKRFVTAFAFALLALAVGVTSAAAHRERHRSPNLALRLSGSPGTVNAGQQVTYTATVVSTGRRSVHNAGFRDQLPAGTTLVSTSPSQGTCSGGPAIVCNLGALATGASATVTIVVTANQPGTITDRAWVSTNPPHGWMHEHSVQTQVQGSSANLALKLTGPRSADQGQQVTYTATIANNGNAAASSSAFQDLLPGKASFVSSNASQGSCTGNPTVVCNLGSLNAGASATVTIAVTANQPGWMTDRGWVSSNPPGNWQHQRVVSTFVHHANAKLDLKLAGPGTVDQGQQVTYTATISNRGNAAAPTAAFQDLLPGKATFVSSSPSQGTCTGTTTVVCSLGSLNAGASATVTIVATANQTGSMTDRGWVSSNPPGNWQKQRTVNTFVRPVASNLKLKLSGSPGTVDKGGQVTYTATVNNGGNATAPTVAFQDLLPGKATLVSSNSSQGSCSGSPIVLCNLGSIAAGGSATVTIVVTANTAGPMTDHGWVSINPPGNWQQERTVQTNVRDVNPTLALRLDGSPGSVNAGQQVTYTATVTNTGNGTDANAGLQDQLPAGAAVVSVTPSQGTCSGSPTVLCNLGSLAPGGSATVTIVVTLSQAGNVTDTAWVSVNPPGGWQHEHHVQTNVHAVPVTTGATTTTTK